MLEAMYPCSTLSLLSVAFQEKDKKDLIEFGVPQGVDFVAASFVQDCACTEIQARELMVQSQR